MCGERKYVSARLSTSCHCDCEPCADSRHCERSEASRLELELNIESELLRYAPKELPCNLLINKESLRAQIQALLHGNLSFLLYVPGIDFHNNLVQLHDILFLL